MNTDHFNNIFYEITNKCLDNDITDYKACYEFHKFKKNDLLLQGIKNRYDMIESFIPMIKKCIENKTNITECYYSKKNKFEYNFPFGYYNEFIKTYEKMKNKNN
jgi:hypothetical protein